MVHAIDLFQSIRDATHILFQQSINANHRPIPPTSKPGGLLTVTRPTFETGITDASSYDGEGGLAVGEFDLALCTYILLELPYAAALLSVAVIT